MTMRQTGYLAILAFALVALAGVLLRPLIPIDETRYLSVAWEMLVSGDWLVPHKNGAIYTDKPPLLFWIINLVWMVFGVSETAARLVGPAFAVASLGATWALGRRLWDDATGAGAAAVLAGLTVFALYGGATMFDTMLTLAVVLGLRALVAALDPDDAQEARRNWILFGVALAFGVYAKGPVILMHLLPGLLTYPLWTPPDHRPAPLRVVRGAGLALAVALALVAVWVLPAIWLGGPEYRHMILWEQSSGRVVSSFAHARPWYFLIAALPVLLFPWIWSPAVWRGLIALPRGDRYLRLCAIWGLAGLGLFSLISGKQAHYLLPEMPAVALIVSRALVSRAVQGRATAGRFAGAALPAAPPAALAAIVTLGLLAASLGLVGKADIALLLQPFWAVLLVAVGFALLLLAALVAPPVAALTMLGLGSVLAMNLLVGLTGLRPAYDSTGLATTLAGAAPDGLAFTGGKYNAEFNFTGRLRAPLDELPDAAAVTAWGTAHPKGILVALCNAKTVSGTPFTETGFNGSRYCLWHGADLK